MYIFCSVFLGKCWLIIFELLQNLRLKRKKLQKQFVGFDKKLIIFKTKGINVIFNYKILTKHTSIHIISI